MTRVSVDRLARASRKAQSSLTLSHSMSMYALSPPRPRTPVSTYCAPSESTYSSQAVGRTESSIAVTGPHFA